MLTVNLYRYVEGDTVTVTRTRRADTDSPYMLRLIADNGKALTNGTDIVYAIDVDDASGWNEVDYTEPQLLGVFM